MAESQLSLARMRYEGADIGYCDISATAARHGRDIHTLPYVMRILLENLERQRLLSPDGPVAVGDVDACVHYEENQSRGILLRVARCILPDSSGLPVLQSLASLRNAVSESGGDPATVSPFIPVDLIVDHSLQVDVAGTHAAFGQNLKRELERNLERYRFLRWAEAAFPKLRIFPPGSGIIHQINMEHIARVVILDEGPDGKLAYPDFVLGGDSHTPMVNGIGVLGWGVGGIDIEAALLGLPYDFPIPEIVGVRLVGRLPAGVTTTDLVLHLTQRLRQVGVVAAFVEFLGEGLSTLTVPERSTISNMAPEYGATAAYFPIDERTLDYLELTRGGKHRSFVEAYARTNALFRTPDAADPTYSRDILFDLSTVRPSVAGPRRPQDRLDLADVPTDFLEKLARPQLEGGFGATALEPSDDGGPSHGAIAIAAITSCTNTSNPSVMVAAGLFARNAVVAGLRSSPYVKTSLAPGSRAVTHYLEQFGLLGPLQQLGFHLVGYGCTTCAGKSGPLLPEIERMVRERGLVAAAVLSGNRNFEGRIHRLVRANYIMSPPLVVAFALAGRVDLNLDIDPLGFRPDGTPVYLRDLWPSSEEIYDLVGEVERAGIVRSIYRETNEILTWNDIERPTSPLFPWDPKSTYLLRAPFFDGATKAGAQKIADGIEDARVIGLFGDSLTTDHISPGGEVPEDSPAGQYLQTLGVQPRNFNTYVGRRGNHEVMMRATFANLRIKNLLVNGQEGGYSRHFPSQRIMTFYDTAATYISEGTPTIILAGTEYGTGSSRDWAAKGTALLGIKAVIAQSYERIHRSNLIGLGVLPLTFMPGESWGSLGLDGSEQYAFHGIRRSIAEGTPVTVVAASEKVKIRFTVRVDAYTQLERRLLMQCGMAGEVLRSVGARREEKLECTLVD